jgi:hypothetical protein
MAKVKGKFTTHLQIMPTADAEMEEAKCKEAERGLFF